MGTRKNQATLSGDERQRFVNAVLQLKANGDYDRYVTWHRELFWQGIHHSELFLPWHRELILRFERDLQAIDSSVDLPYWDWTVDRSTNASPWTETFLGGNGQGFSGRVSNGPFAFSTGDFDITVTDPPVDPGPGLRRGLADSSLLPTSSMVRSVLRLTNYSDFNGTIRAALHNNPHNWVGGSMAARTSPNDPVFFMHHGNLDRLWAVWQSLHPSVPHFEGSNAPMPPWFGSATPTSVVDHRDLGYEYDTDPDALPSPITDLTVGASPTAADISRGAEVDVFRFSAVSFGSYTIETQGETDVLMSLLGPDSQTDLVTEDDDSGQGRNARIVSTLSPGTYFVRIRHYDPARTGSYNIFVSATPTRAIQEVSVNGDIVAGNIAAANESDVYMFSAATSGIYTIETLGNTDTFLSLYGPNSQTSFLGFDDDSGPRLNARIVADLLVGVYFLRVRHYSPTGTGPYDIRLTR